MAYSLWLFYLNPEGMSDLVSRSVSFKDFLLKSANGDLQGLDLRRDKSLMREIDL
jgi:hypothetical protein